MIDAASLDTETEDIEYFGFDLFDLFTADVLESELSKEPLSLREVDSKLAETGAKIQLFQGLSQETLPRFVEQRENRPIDFIFIDGGHSIATIENDWTHCRAMVGASGAIYLDDYYDNEEFTGSFGCNQLVARLKDDAEWTVTILPVQDRFPEIGGVQIVRVSPSKGA